MFCYWFCFSLRCYWFGVGFVCEWFVWCLCLGVCVCCFSWVCLVLVGWVFSGLVFVSDDACLYLFFLVFCSIITRVVVGCWLMVVVWCCVGLCGWVGFVGWCFLVVGWIWGGWVYLGFGVCAVCLVCLFWVVCGSVVGMGWLVVLC